MEQQQSFYSIHNSKTEFTFEEGGEAVLRKEKGILEKFDIRQSSAAQLGESDLNRSLSSLGNREGIDVNDISAIDQQQPNELECSLCLQNQIDCLSVPAQPSPQQVKALQQKIAALQNRQSILQKQISLIHSLPKQSSPLEPFIKKQCRHAEEPSNGTNAQISLRSGKEQAGVREGRQQQKQFDIKPNKTQTASQKQANAKYKQCSFNRTAVLIEDTQNEYRVEVTYERDAVRISVVNFQKGETNFMRCGRINEGLLADKISQTMSYPMEKYVPKKFTLSLSIMLLIFSQGKEKQQANLLQIDELRSISLPFPINYFIQPRFTHSRPPHALHRQLYIYHIDINYNADYAAFAALKAEAWVANHWITLRGSHRLIWVHLGEVREREGTFGVDFRVGCKEKDCQQAVDLIEYLCFMLTI